MKILLFVIFSTLFATGAQQELKADEELESTPYTAMWQAKRTTPTDGNPESREFRFEECVASETLGEAKEKWEAFLEKFGDLQDDGRSQRLLRQARYELVRVYYMLGEHEKGDELFNELRNTDDLFSGYIAEDPL